MTLLQIVNRVLKRLREDTVSSIDETDYSLMITEMLYDVHLQCLEAHDWSAMESIVNVPVDANQRVFDLTRTETNGGDVDDADTVTKNDSHVVNDRFGRPQAWLFDDSSDTDGDRLILISEKDMEDLYQTDRDQTNDDPSYFSVRMSPDRAGLQMTIWPPPTSTKHIRLRVWTPEDPIDSSDEDSRTVLVPDRPLLLGTIMLALNERGEELGEPGNIAERRFYDALSGAIEQDTKRRGWVNEYEAWRE